MYYIIASGVSPKGDSSPKRRRTKKVSFTVADANKWYVLLEDAKMGKYPPMNNLGELFRARTS